MNKELFIEYFLNQTAWMGYGDFPWFLKSVFIEETEDFVYVACFWYDASRDIHDSQLKEYSLTLTNSGPILSWRK